MSENTRHQNIVIVGGGTAGWMAAAYLKRRLRTSVTLIESPSIPTVGVGEATIPALLDFLRGMRIDETEFMRRCHATYKLAIRFEDWLSPGHRYWHPFGLCGGRINGLDLFHYWFQNRVAGTTNRRYVDYSLQADLCESDKAHRHATGQSVVENYAFHLDSAAFATFLQETAVADGVHRIVDDVVDVRRNERGQIENVVTASGQQLTADFYIDCTGFRGLLIEQCLDDPWVDWSSQLLCDRAVVTHQPPSRTMPPYTRAVALSAGWMWQIPLSSRVGCGYVYSSRHISDDDATRELRRFAGRDAETDVRQLSMRVGRRQNFWVGNCLSLGLSAGFVEPLESTGIFLIQRGLEEFVECYPGGVLNEPLAKLYNRRLSDAYDEVRDFVLLHYLVTRRSESFWQDSRNVEVSSALAERLALYRETGFLLEADRNPVFRETNYFHVLLGGDCLPERCHPRVTLMPTPTVADLLNRIRRQNQNAVRQLPRHDDLLDEIHRGPSLTSNAIHFETTAVSGF